MYNDYLVHLVFMSWILWEIVKSNKRSSVQNQVDLCNYWSLNDSEQGRLVLSFFLSFFLFFFPSPILFISLFILLAIYRSRLIGERIGEREMQIVKWRIISWES